MAEYTMVAALNGALRHALAADRRTLVFGEDVGALGEPPASEIFDHAFADPPPTLLAQREELLGDG